MLLNTLIVLSALLLCGCFVDEKITATQSPLESEQTLISEVKEGALYIIEDNSTYKLADDALDYRVIPSPKRSRLAVETVLFSNLTVVRFYKKDPGGRYRYEDTPAATEVWSELSEREGVAMENIRFAKTRFIRWEDEKHVHINLYGIAESKKIDRNVMIQLP